MATAKKKAAQSTASKTNLLATKKGATISSSKQNSVRLNPVKKKTNTTKSALAKNKPVLKPTKKTRKLTSVKKKTANTDLLLTITVQFRKGVGEIIVKIFRGGTFLQSHTWQQTGDFSFPTIRSEDEVAISGLCSGTASLVANLPTTPVTPRNYQEGFIDDGITIN